MPQSTIPLVTVIWRRGLLGPCLAPPFKVKVNLSGQAHTSPRAELLAIALAIEQARWPIHIFSDNKGFVVATQRLLKGGPTTSLRDNQDLWGRIVRRLHAKQKNIKITWIKGHAEDKDIIEGSSSIAHKSGNDAADLPANTGSKLIELPPLLHKGHELKRHIVIAIQAMFLACYTRRQNRRQELDLETLLERELEDAPAIENLQGAHAPNPFSRLPKG